MSPDKRSVQVHAFNFIPRVEMYVHGEFVSSSTAGPAHLSIGDETENLEANWSLAAMLIYWCRK